MHFLTYPLNYFDVSVLQLKQLVVYLIQYSFFYAYFQKIIDNTFTSFILIVIYIILNSKSLNKRIQIKFCTIHFSMVQNLI